MDAVPAEKTQLTDHQTDTNHTTTTRNTSHRKKREDNVYKEKTNTQHTHSQHALGERDRDMSSPFQLLHIIIFISKDTLSLSVLI